VRESAKPLLYFCNTRPMPASLLIDQRKILFYKKIICGSNVGCAKDTRQSAVCIIMRYRESSTYDISPGHSSYSVVKRTFWSFFVSLLSY